MTFWQLLRDVKLFRLLRVRWTGQLTDGIFQSALASFVLFSPERQASAVNAAVAFAVVLLPYSIVGPFVGTILDRFSRQRAIFFGIADRHIALMLNHMFFYQSHKRHPCEIARRIRFVTCNTGLMFIRLALRRRVEIKNNDKPIIIE